MQIVEPVDSYVGSVPACEGELLIAGQPDQRQRCGDLAEPMVVYVVGVAEPAMVWNSGHSAEPAVRVGGGHVLPRARHRTECDSAGLAATNSKRPATARRSSLTARIGTGLHRPKVLAHVDDHDPAPHSVDEAQAVTVGD
ncbi:hypothetical protein [Rhodococcoides yunnanense]|uniref:hypothetical protein n=1 Tax=Rhodococcoides yunnanense TaxID=278209 RepID=UPI002481EF8B|nr:hypothetical protein [Rhodococcus yunnanensis]